MKDKNKKTIIILLSILLVLIVVVSSIVVVFISASSNRQTLKWIKQMIEQNYYPALPENFDAFVAKNGGAVGNYGEVYQAINNDLLDRYSRFYTKEEYQTQQKADSGQGVGVGLAFEAGTNTLARIPIGSPLYFANDQAEKVEVGMSLTKIDNVTVSNFNDIQLAMQKYSVNDTIALTFTAMTSTSVTQQEVMLNVQAKPYTESYLLYTYQQRAYAYLYPNSLGVNTGWTEVTKYTPQTQLLNTQGVAYLKLSSFMGESNKEFDYAMQQYKADGATTLLLDLRNNGGGYVDHMADIAKYFLKDSTSNNNVVMTAQFKNNKREETRIKQNLYKDFLSTSKVKVMANQNSASASEALIGVLINYKAISYKDLFITEINGSARTYGKGIMQSTFVHPFGGYAIKLTTAQIYWPDGITTIHNKGVTAGNGAMQATVSGSYSPFAYGDPELKAVLGQI